MIINDGTGNGFSAGVDSNKRLQTFSVIRDEQDDATNRASSFVLISGPITLTSALESAVFYFSSNELLPVMVDAIIVGTGLSTGGATDDTTTFKVLKNPTLGTIISSPTNADILSNRNFASQAAMNGDIFKGAEADTLTDGNLHFQASIPVGSFVLDSGISMANGNSIGIQMTPPAANTSIVIEAGIVCHITELTL